MTASEIHDDPRRDALVRQARMHFISDGYVGTRMEPIAREAGVSTATLYAMFENKAALFMAVIAEAGADFSARMSRMETGDDGARARLTGFLVAYAEFISDPFVRAILRLVIAERARFETVAMDLFDRARRDFGSVLIATLDDMKAKGELKFDKASWAAGQLMGMVEHPVIAVPILTGDQVIAKRSPKTIALDAVETFMARYGA